MVYYLCVYSLTGLGSSNASGPGGGGEQNWNSLGFCFSWKKRGGRFFWIGLGFPLGGGRKYPESPAAAALRAARGGCPGSAPDAFGMPFLPRRAGGSLARRLAHSRTRLKYARSCLPADPLSYSRTRADSHAALLGRSQHARDRRAGNWRCGPEARDLAGRFLGDKSRVGKGGSPDSPTATDCRAFVLFLLRGPGPPLRRPRGSVQPLAFCPVSFAFALS